MSFEKTDSMSGIKKSNIVCQSKIIKIPLEVSEKPLVGRKTPCGLF